ncbi:MAG TPA: hypothetical protein VFJ90_13865 [Candidatus Didemnitutus sp.]|nr:hypothetical protein [Candidatus Didemnitutus sp.]
MPAMITKLKLVLPAILSMAVGLIAADTKPAMVVQVVETDQVDAYVDALAKINARIKAVAGVDTLRHTWVGDQAGESSHGVFVVSSYESAAAAAALTTKMNQDAELPGMVAALKSIRKLGPSFLYKAVRFEGLYPGGAVFNTSINCTDEDAYVKALDGLKAIFDTNGFKDAKVNLYRIVAGRSESTHLVVICLPNTVRVAELLDAISDKMIIKDWQAAAAKIRTTIRNGTYHEITK